VRASDRINVEAGKVEDRLRAKVNATLNGVLVMIADMAAQNFREDQKIPIRSDLSPILSLRITILWQDVTEIIMNDLIRLQHRHQELLAKELGEIEFKAGPLTDAEKYAIIDRGVDGKNFQTWMWEKGNETLRSVATAIKLSAMMETNGIKFYDNATAKVKASFAAYELSIVRTWWTFLAYGRRDNEKLIADQILGLFAA
jgi:hypothetical protein